MPEWKRGGFYEHPAAPQPVPCRAAPKRLCPGEALAYALACVFLGLPAVCLRPHLAGHSGTDVLSAGFRYEQRPAPGLCAAQGTRPADHQLVLFTELRVFHNHLVFAPLFFFSDNWLQVRTIGTAIILLAMLGPVGTSAARPASGISSRPSARCWSCPCRRSISASRC